MTQRFVYLLLFPIFLSFFVSCSNEDGGALRRVPSAYGALNQLAVISDENIWESAVGDTFQYYFSSAYLILPQPEPIFDLVHFTQEAMKLEPVRKELRSYIVLANLADETSPTTKMVVKDLGQEGIRRAMEEGKHIRVGKNKWANGQLLIYIFGNSHDEVIEAIKENYLGTTMRLREEEKDQWDATIFFSGENKEVQERIQSKYDFGIRVPKEYEVAIDDTTTIWLREESDRSSSNVMITRIPHVSEDQLTREGFKAIRDTIGRKYITTSVENTYMKINDKDLPMFVETGTLDGQFALTARGIWEMENDYVAGPFVSYLVLHPATKELLLIDGFVLAPGTKKRNLIQRVDFILNTVKFAREG